MSLTKKQRSRRQSTELHPGTKGIHALTRVFRQRRKKLGFSLFCARVVLALAGLGAASLSGFFTSDRGTQYTALSFGKRLEEVGIVPSMGGRGSALDNAISESFVATLKVEPVHACRFPTREAARSAIFEYLEVFCN